MLKFTRPLALCLISVLWSNFAIAKDEKAAAAPVTPPPPVSDNSSPEADESWGRNLWLDFISPVTTRAWIPLAAGGVLTTAIYSSRGKIENPLQNNWDVHHPLGKADPVGNLLGQLIPNIAYFGGMYADYWWGSQDKKSRERAILMFRATAYAGLLTNVVKYAVHERRPNGSDRLSFPSGHSATAFAFASVVGAEHEWYWGLPAYAMATFVGATRIADNMHRLHDVLAGATIGMSYGLGVYYHWHEKDDANRTTFYQVLPTDDISGAVFTVTHNF